MANVRCYDLQTARSVVISPFITNIVENYEISRGFVALVRLRFLSLPAGVPPGTPLENEVFFSLPITC
jgi:hypothetical protein